MEASGLLEAERRDQERRQRQQARALCRREGFPLPPRSPLSLFPQAVVYDSGDIAGAVELILVPYPARPAPLKPYLFNLSVLPTFRRQGIARKLVEWCEERCRMVMMSGRGRKEEGKER
eukprot:760001-Hanusia_phi.AAC.1